MSVKVTGKEQLSSELVKLRQRIDASLNRELTIVARRMWRELRRRLSFPFQTVPSYIFWNDKYPDDTPAYFATSSPEISDDWKGQTQLKEGSDHKLRDLLEVEVTRSPNGDLTAGVGYPESVNEPYIEAVLFGTPKMQPRPFLDEILKDYESEFAKAAERAFSKAFQ